MAGDRLLVGFVAEITPAPAPPFERAFDDSPAGFRCTFSDGAIARLRPGRGATTWLRILAERQRRGAPVSVAVADDLTIVRLLLPDISRRPGVRQERDGVVEVAVFPSECIHRLSRENPDFEALHALLLDGVRAGNWLLITATDDHEIVHVSALSPADLATMTLPAERRDRLPQIGRAAQWPLWLNRWWRAIVPKTWYVRVLRANQLQALFDLVAAETCDACNPTSDCIPFLYPDAGCRSRAHEMRRLISIGTGFSPDKVWIGPVVAKTKNSPLCAVSWSFHVALVIDAIGTGATLESYVIDPSLCDGPVLLADWVAKMTGPNLQTTIRPGYLYSPTDPDDTYAETQAELDHARTNLLNRCNAKGPPPYC